jgi:hypothetical protein
MDFSITSVLASIVLFARPELHILAYKPAILYLVSLIVPLIRRLFLDIISRYYF